MSASTPARITLLDCLKCVGVCRKFADLGLNNFDAAEAYPPSSNDRDIFMFGVGDIQNGKTRY